MLIKQALTTHANVGLPSNSFLLLHKPRMKFFKLFWSIWLSTFNETERNGGKWKHLII